LANLDERPELDTNVNTANNVNIESCAGEGAAPGEAANGEQDHQGEAVRVVVTRGGMAAYLEVAAGASLSLEGARQRLSEAGVCCGIKEEVLKRAVKEGAARGGRFLVAEGTEPVPGKDGKVVYEFETGDRKIKPVENEDGRVDYVNLDLVQNIRAGARLARLVPPTIGVPGKTVTGKEVPARPGREPKFGAGPGASLSDSRLEIVAERDGQPVLDGPGLISVRTVYEVKDVDLSTGNIDFVGTVLVRGNVGHGLCVRAEGDVQVDGYVDGGTVRSKGNVLVRRGIQGRNQGEVHAGGNVTAFFIENATVVAGGNVDVGSAIMHSRVTAGGSVSVGGRRGLIVGGWVRARNEIRAKTIGAEMGTPTVIEVGVDARVKEELIEVYQKVRQIQADVRKIEQALKILKDMERKYGRLPEDRKVVVLKLMQNRYRLRSVLEALEERRKNLEQALKANRQARVMASRVFYPRVEITIGRANRKVLDPILESVASVSAEGDIVFKTYPAGGGR